MPKEWEKVLDGGRYGDVAFIPDHRGEYLGRNFVLGLSDKYQAKFLVRCAEVADHGPALNPKKFKNLGRFSVEGSTKGTTLTLWEMKFRHEKFRVLGAWDGQVPTFLIAHGVQKTEDALEERDLRLALRILSSFLGLL